MKKKLARQCVELSAKTGLRIFPYRGKCAVNLDRSSIWTSSAEEAFLPNASSWKLLEYGEAGWGGWKYPIDPLSTEELRKNVHEVIQ